MMNWSPTVMSFGSDIQLIEAALRRNLFRLAFASFMTNSTTWLYRLTTSYIVWEQTKSGIMLSLLAAAEFLPNIAMTPYAGVMADRIRLKHSSYVICGLLGILSMAAVVVTGGLPYDKVAFSIIGITAAMSIVSAVSRPVHQKILGYVFTEQSIGQALSLNTIGLNIGRVAAPIVLIGLIAQDLLWASYFLNGLSYVVIGYTTFAFEYVREQAASVCDRSTIHAAIADGLRRLKEHHALRQLLTLAMVEAVCLSSFFELLPMLSDSYLGTGAEMFTRISISIAVFSFIAGLLKLLSPVRLDPNKFLIVLLLAAGLIAVGLNSGSLLWAALAFGLASFLIVLVRIRIMELIHVQTPDSLKGQALGYYFLSTFGGGTAGAALYGALYDFGFGSYLTSIPIFVLIGFQVLWTVK